MKPIAMKCTQEQYNKIRPILLENGFIERYISSFKDFPYLINNWGPKDYVLGNGDKTFIKGREVFEEWNEDTFLEYCGIKKETFPKDDFGVIVINNNAKEIVEYLVSKGFDRCYQTGIAANFAHYYISKNKSKIGCTYINPTSKTYTLEQLKKLDMQKEIIGYKLIKPEYRKVAAKIIEEEIDFNDRGFDNLSLRAFINQNSIKLLRQAGILDLWFEPVYKSSETKYTMGSNNDTFELVVRDGKCFHKSYDITNYVKYIQQNYSNIICNNQLYKYAFNIKDVIISKTGCENKETLLSQWLNIKL